MARVSHVRKRLFFVHSDPHGAALFNGRFLVGMPDDDLLQRPIVGSAGALEAVGDYEAHPTVMLEDVPQDIVFKTLKGSCACVAVLVFVYVCVLVRATQMAVIGFIFPNSSAVVKEF